MIQVRVQSGLLKCRVHSTDHLTIAGFPARLSSSYLKMFSAVGLPRGLSPGGCAWNTSKGWWFYSELPPHVLSPLLISQDEPSYLPEETHWIYIFAMVQRRQTKWLWCSDFCQVDNISGIYVTSQSKIESHFQLFSVYQISYLSILDQRPAHDGFRYALWAVLLACPASATFG